MSAVPSGPAAPAERRAGAPAAEAYRRALADLEREGRAGPPWLREARRAALARFEAVGFPTLRDEDWRYTSVAPIVRLPHRPAGPAAATPAAALAPHALPGSVGARLVFVDGRFDPALSTSEPLPPGAWVGSLARLLAERPDELRGHLGRLADPARGHAFVATNAALFEDGAAVVLPPRTCLPAPIDVVFARTGSPEARAAHVRVLVLAGAGTRATVLERHLSLSPGASYTNVVTEADLAPGAHLEHLAWQDASDDALHVATTHVRQGRDSVFVSHALSFGAALSRSELDVVLAEEGAECSLHGLYLADGTRHVDHHTRIDHARPRGTSVELYKGVLGGAGRGVFQGRIVVHPDAQRTDARQANHNLLLSDDASVETKPQLEIFADDVKCAHGTTVGQLEPDHVFYLRSRGLGVEDARAMLVRAFARDVVDRVDVPALRPLLEARLDARLPRGAPR